MKEGMVSSRKKSSNWEGSNWVSKGSFEEEEEGKGTERKSIGSLAKVGVWKQVAEGLEARSWKDGGAGG